MFPKQLAFNTIIFDMDGVITHTMPDHFRAWKTILKRHGIRVSHHDIYIREGQKGRESVVELFRKYNKKISSINTHRLLKQKEEFFKRIVKRRFIIGSRQFLRALYRQKFKLALVTGTSRPEMNRILPSSLCELFHVTVTGSDVKSGKPHPEPFLKAIKLLNSPVQKSIVIENAPLGIRSAKSAGLKCIALETSLPRKYLSEADYTFSSFRELKQKVNFVLEK